ncbi:MAG: hypothetical protein V7664_00895 [Qipengyuania sp.]|uniref:hypothetical protein n=1 Tax=Qipengyuania sp. TaxID=2004515 RepID=UPI0030037AEE
MEISLASPVYVENKYLALSASPVVNNMIKTAQAQLANNRSLAEKAAANGAVWQSGQGLRITHGIAEKLAPELKLVQAYQHQMSAAFRECADLHSASAALPRL